MEEIVYLAIFAVIVLVVGLREKSSHDRNLNKIPTRILINGIRGKSTVTRLIMGILKEDGRRVAGKTTGTSARMFYWDQEEEEPIVRSLQGPNISEQKTMAKRVVKREADAFVSECMAVNPEYQRIFQERLVKANITVIANVIEDHMDVMGPTLDDIAEAFSSTIPHNGHVVIPDTPYKGYFEKIARRRNSKVVVADESLFEEEYLKKFPFMIFPQNAALSLAVADILEIDREVALRGMLTAPVDPGAMRVHRFGKKRAPKYFFNGFAANDITSTLNIWERIQELDYPTDEKTVIMNCRSDRVERTIDFAERVLPHIDMDNLIVMGETVDPVINAYNDGSITASNVINLENKSAEVIVEHLQDLPGNSVIYGIGNIVGGGEELAAAIQDLEIVPSLSDYQTSWEEEESHTITEEAYEERTLQTNK
ncbi:poly-gamma-glutamate synthase PgsB [Halobacillus halophilus]|uniref:PGA synthase CapB n=1 Tax=Halobacillus halophilus (strain ATCC 35676 / DSM 2266 / JCM 20832 / KCTC 3685 / LMG 17431 / NBRC 102448 / NCIMB 2269) TaxID=866895 RepID=I0JQH9_HALH3|nr:poly-gamma-glutamate synthase PgsB [Halobacillus halophilus]CCG46399.1 PGA synthase CapB [Halobacillus halophilus DSM 2266]